MAEGRRLSYFNAVTTGWRTWATLRHRWLALLALVIFAILSLGSPLDTDEGQYVAAASLVARGLLPYRDFPYLQTPLQPLLLAPLAWAAEGWTLVALRLVNGLCVTLAILLIGRTAAALARDTRAGGVAMLLAMTCNPLLYAGSIARNDALPMLLLAGALERLYTTSDLRKGRAFLVGLLAAAAASAKISYALPAAAIGLQALLASRSRADRRTMLALIAGLVVGALPSLVFLLVSPRPFLFQVYTYSVVAVRAWAELKGGSWRLSVPFRTIEWTWGMLQGPMLAMLVLCLLLRQRGLVSNRAQPLIALGPIVAAAVLASVLPMPALRQYLVPVAAPLIPWFVARAWPVRDGRRRRAAIRSLAGTAALGVAFSLLPLVSTDVSERPLPLAAESHRIGQVARAAGASSIATLEPVRAVDSGVPLDPRFATGQFLFRAGNVPGCGDPAQCPVTVVSLDRLNASPPGAVLTGTQRKHPRSTAGGLDGSLDRWAAASGYRPVPISPRSLLWLAPLPTLWTRKPERYCNRRD